MSSTILLAISITIQKRRNFFQENWVWNHFAKILMWRETTSLSLGCTCLANFCWTTGILRELSCGGGPSLCGLGLGLGAILYCYCGVTVVSRSHGVFTSSRASLDVPGLTEMLTASWSAAHWLTDWELPGQTAHQALRTTNTTAPSHLPSLPAREYEVQWLCFSYRKYFRLKYFKITFFKVLMELPSQAETLSRTYKHIFNDLKIMS